MSSLPDVAARPAAPGRGDRITFRAQLAPTLRTWAAAAWFDLVAELGIEHPPWKAYRVG